MVDIVGKALAHARSVTIFGGKCGPVVPSQGVPGLSHSSLLKVSPNFEDKVTILDMNLRIKQIQNIIIMVVVFLGLSSEGYDVRKIFGILDPRPSPLCLHFTQLISTVRPQNLPIF